MITDKRFAAAPGHDHVTLDELAPLLRLGARTKTFVLLMLHCGKLRGLDSTAGASSAGAARYRIAK